MQRFITLVAISLACTACQTTANQGAQPAPAANTSALAQVIQSPGSVATSPTASSAGLVAGSSAPATAGGGRETQAGPSPSRAQPGLPIQINAFQAEPASAAAPATTPSTQRNGAQAPATAPEQGTPATPAPASASSPVQTLYSALNAGRPAAGSPALVAVPAAQPIVPSETPTEPQSPLAGARVAPPRTESVTIQGLQPDPHVQRAVSNARRSYSAPDTPATAPNGLSSSDIRRLF